MDALNVLALLLLFLGEMAHLDTGQDMVPGNNNGNIVLIKISCTSPWVLQLVLVVFCYCFMRPLYSSRTGQN